MPISENYNYRFGDKKKIPFKSTDQNVFQGKLLVLGEMNHFAQSCSLCLVNALYWPIT